MNSKKNLEQLGALLCACGAFSLYLFTLAPVVQGFDSAELTMGAYDLGFVHPPGYPLYLTIGHIFTLFPIGNVGFRMNLMSAVFASLSIYILYKLTFRQSQKFWVSLVFTTLLASAPIFWSQAIRAEVYTLHVFLMTASLLAWYDGYTNNRKNSYFLSFLLLGLGAGNHPTTILLWLSFLTITIFLDPPNRRSYLIANGFAFLIAAACYFYFPWRAGATLQIDYIRPYFHIDPGTFSGALWMITGRPFQCLLIPQGPASSGLEFLRLFDFIWTGTLGFGLFFAAWGWFELHKRKTLWNHLLTIYFLANLFMFIAYHAVDKEVMFIPIYVIISIWGAAGFPVFARWINSLQDSVDQSTFELLLSVALFSILLVALFNDLPNISLRNNRRVYEYARELLESVEPDSSIVNHWATASVIDYLQIVDGLRPDVESLNVDFYFLGVQEACQPPSSQDLLKNGWIPWLSERSSHNQLCFIEPLHNLPDGYKWIHNGKCWQVEEGSEQE